MTCVERWPECESGKYDPRCCRFPKSCSVQDVCTKKQPHSAHSGCPGQTVPGEDPAVAYTADITFRVEASGNQAQALDMIGHMLRFMKINILKTITVIDAEVIFHNEGIASIVAIDPADIPVKKL